MVNGRWKSKVDEVKKEVFRFSQNKFKETCVSRHKLINPYFKSISMMDAIMIESPFTLDEVKKYMWMCGNAKELVPDGYNFKFMTQFGTLLEAMR